MKIFWGAIALMGFAAMPLQAQGLGGSPLSPLSWTPPSRPDAVEVSGSAGYIASSFVAFESAVAEGRMVAENRVAIRTESKSVADAAAEARAEEKPAAKVVFVQDNNGRVVRERQTSW